MSQNEIADTMAEIEDFIVLHQIESFAELVYYARKRRSGWHLLLSANPCAVQIAKFLCKCEREDMPVGGIPFPERVSDDVMNDGEEYCGGAGASDVKRAYVEHVKRRKKKEASRKCEKEENG